MLLLLSVCHYYIVNKYFARKYSRNVCQKKFRKSVKSKNDAKHQAAGHNQTNQSVDSHVLEKRHSIERFFAKNCKTNQISHCANQSHR